MTAIQSYTFWGFLLLYGAVMYLLSPRVRTADGFYRGSDAAGLPVSQWSLTASIFISWIFAKSVTNAANLGAGYGLVGGLAYATYWLSIPFAGLVIYFIRTRTGATSLHEFLASRFGRAAAIGFSVAILIRLYNEVWSNTAVVGGYFGAPGESGYYLSALLFTLATLAYSLKGGLRSSIFTDLIQTAVFVLFLLTVLFMVLPRTGITPLVTSGRWALDGGVDLLLVAGLQIFSYPFHDPVLTDRGFINRERHMLLSFAVAGLLGFLAVLLFSLVGVYAKVNGIAVQGNAPAAVGMSLGVLALFAMSVIMMTSAGSTLDSTFTSLSKFFAIDLSRLFGRTAPAGIGRGALVMVLFAVLGNLPMLAGTEILKATTVSGTMVLGLAPVFLFWPWARRSAASFHLAFWPGVVIGILLAGGWLPTAWAIGGGKYALLLGANLWGVLIATAGFWIGQLPPLRADP